jgi:hypothetical protein
MFKSMLTGLNRLHSGDYVYRDIRLPNFVYVPNNEQFSYVLIDFEHGGVHNEKVSGELLRGYNNETLSRDSRYTKHSDIHQFGKLLKSFSNIIASDEGKDFMIKLKGKKFGASKTLKHNWLNNYKRLTSH